MGKIILKELKAAQPCELVETDGASPLIRNSPHLGLCLGPYGSPMWGGGFL